MTDSDESLKYYLRCLESDARAMHPKVNENIFRSAMEWAEGELEKVLENDNLRSGIPPVPLCPDHEVIVDLLRFLIKLKPDTDDSSWMRRCMFEGDNTELAEELLSEIEQALADRENSCLKTAMNLAMGKLDTFFKATENMEEDTRDLMFGKSPAEFTYREIQSFEKFSQVFSKDRTVREFTDLLGRSGGIQRISNGRVESFDGTSHCRHQGTEIIGIEMAREISNMLPAESMLMCDPEMSKLFDFKFIEGRLMCFSREMMVRSSESKLDEAETNDKIGPIIMIVDTSGSMAGKRLFAAKCLCFTIATRAAMQDRNIYRIDFNVAARAVDMTPRNHMHALLNFLGTSADGGTDPSLALSEAVRITQMEHYTNADLVVISDFELDMGLFEKDRTDIKDIRKQGCRIHSVYVNERKHKGVGLFDSEWYITHRFKQKGLVFSKST